MIDYVSEEKIKELKMLCTDLQELQQQLLTKELYIREELKKIEIERYEGKTLIQHINSLERVINPKGEGNENITIEIKNGQIFGYYKINDGATIQLITSLYSDDINYREHTIYTNAYNRIHPTIPKKYYEYVEPLKKCVKRYKIEDFSRNIRLEYNLSFI